MNPNFASDTLKVTSVASVIPNRKKLCFIEPTDSTEAGQTKISNQTGFKIFLALRIGIA